MGREFSFLFLNAFQSHNIISPGVWDYCLADVGGPPFRDEADFATLVNVDKLLIVMASERSIHKY